MLNALVIIFHLVASNIWAWLALIGLLSTGVGMIFYRFGSLANVSWDFGFLRGVLASPRFHRWHNKKNRCTR